VDLTWQNPNHICAAHHVVDLPQRQPGDDHKPGAVQRFGGRLVLRVSGVERRDQPRDVRYDNHAAERHPAGDRVTRTLRSLTSQVAHLSLLPRLATGRMRKRS
jgi:hypothetical protein